ncbi:hypothetical protein LSUCC0031_13425 [Rhodobacterales bacterium LSUCC0031]|nr:hypothetical protein [Rhodobacterales bacterium LSUCC0031]
MSEHKASPFLLRLMSLFFWAMALCALAFWVGGAVWPGGLTGLIAALGPGSVAIFATFHIPAAVVGILLWQWQRHGMARRKRALLEGATLYFMGAVLLGIFLNYLLVSAL